MAFGLAVKLVYRKYEQFPNIHLRPKFWQEVEGFYREYCRNQERLITSPRSLPMPVVNAALQDIRASEAAHV